MAETFTYDVFLSHSAKDKATVRKLAKRLKKDGLRVLGNGTIDRGLHVVAQHFTKGAQEKIAGAGGKCEVPSL